MTPPLLDEYFASRIAAKVVNLTPDEALNQLHAFPAPHVKHHWVWTGAGASAGTPFMNHAGRLRSAPRLILEVIAQAEIPPSWKAARACPIHNCIHPSCHTLRPYRQARFGLTHPLPSRLQLTQSGSQQDIDDLLNEFEGIDNPTLEIVLATYARTFDEGTIRRAFGVYQAGQR